CGTCDFESGSGCGWVNMTTYTQKWLLTNARESGNSYATTFDGRANRNGHYLVMSPPTFGRVSNAETALNFYTPIIYLKNAYKSCVMQFDYYLATTQSNYSLKVRIGRDRSDWDTIYSISRQSTGGWRK